MTVKALIKEIEKLGMSLSNDARYYDLCRTHGDASPEVKRYLRCIVRLGCQPS